jgi:hypothetical protein
VEHAERRRRDDDRDFIAETLEDVHGGLSMSVT